MSPATLGIYVKKAQDFVVKSKLQQKGAPLNYLKHNKMRDREIGIDRALDKLVKKAETRKPESKKNVKRRKS